MQAPSLLGRDDDNNYRGEEFDRTSMHGLYPYKFLVPLKSLEDKVIYKNLWKPTLSEETAQPTVYHHLSQMSVDVQLNGLIKYWEDSSFLMQVTQLIFRPLSWVLPESAA